MVYRFDGDLLSRHAGELRGLAGDLSWAGGRISSVLAMVGRYSGSAAGLAGVAEGMGLRATDFESRAAFLVSWNRCWVPPVADPVVVGAAVATIRAALDESWFGDVSRDELLTVGETLGALGGPEFDAAIASLSDNELYRWFHELDGVRGGNLSEPDEAALFASLVGRGSAATSWRLAQAERGTRLQHITAAIAEHPDPAVRVEYLWWAAADPANTEHALASLSVLDSLDPPWQALAAERLGSERLEELSDTLADYLDEIDPFRDDAIPVEFVEGIWDGAWEMGAGLVGLTIQGLWDRHAFRENWAGLAGGVALLFRDPAAFFSALIDLEGLRANPAHWAGSLVPEVGAALLTGGTAAAARSGRLGTTLTRLTTKLDDLAVVARLRALHDVRLASRLVRGPNGLFGNNPVELRTRKHGRFSKTLGQDVRAFHTEALGGEAGALAFFARRTGVTVLSVDRAYVATVAGIRYTLRPSRHGAPTVEVFDTGTATVEKLRFLEGGITK